MKSRDGNKSKIQTAEKIFSVLEVLARNGGGLRLRDIAKELDMPVSTAHRLTSSLLDLGYLTQDPASGGYILGLKLLFLASAVLQRLDLRRLAACHLEKLRDLTGETANLVVLDHDEVLYIEKAESRAMVRSFSLIGARAPVHATGAGKVLLADMAWPDVQGIVRRRGMPRITEHTITSLSEFMKELDCVRSRGYALDLEECEVGARCVAAPVRNHTGRVIASISISGPVNRLSDDRLPELIKIVTECGAQLSRQLGYFGSDVPEGEQGPSSRGDAALQVRRP